MERLSRLCFLILFPALLTSASSIEHTLPMGSAPEPLEVPHFPTREHAFVWRNWSCVDASRIAEVLDASEDELREMAASMGLPPEQKVSDLQAERGYISVIRRNWHLLPYDQLLLLLGWDEERLAYTLKEDDFLWIKLGRSKPNCRPLRYRELTPEELNRCHEIRNVVRNHFGDTLAQPMEPRFSFVERLSSTGGTPPKPSDSQNAPIRFLYSYFAVYGDPLLNPQLDPYPDGLLERLAAQGINGVWLHTVLRQLAPSRDFPEFGKDADTRLENLRRLVKRGKRHGVKIYLYMNEPRSMPAEFYEKYPNIAGTREDNNIAMCTSVPEVRRFVTESLAHVFREVPDLGGVFTITASENLTNCWSRGGQNECPRCSKRAAAEVISEINRAIAEGVWKGNRDASVIVWDWGWRDDWAEAIIRSLPDGVYLMSVSEWDLPIERGGVPHRVGEYSMSCVGPGPRAQRHWAWAKERGLKTLAKVQVNCTWELSAIPYIPVMDLVGQHMANLSKMDIDGLMVSWTLGGYPSPNLELVHRFAQDPPPDLETTLADLARERFGSSAAPKALQAWSTWSQAFQEFPFDIRVLYGAPSQVGPANPLFPKRTGHAASMAGLPCDDLTTWRGVYPADVFAQQFHRLAKRWREGLELMRTACSETESKAYRKNAEVDLQLAEAAHTHFKSVANQAEFVLARDELASGSQSKSEREESLAMIERVAGEEIELAKWLFELTCRDSRIGYEASNHYYYYPLDLVEKVINCEYVLREWLPAKKARADTTE
jgi:hypothetical protein